MDVSELSDRERWWLDLIRQATGAECMWSGGTPHPLAIVRRVEVLIEMDPTVADEHDD